MNRQIGLGIALSLPLAITAWGCNGQQIESGVKTTGTKLEQAGGAIKDAAPAAGKAVDKAGEKLKDLKDKVGPEIKDLEHKAGQLEQKAGEKLKSLEDKAKDFINRETGKN